MCPSMFTAAHLCTCTYVCQFEVLSIDIIFCIVCVVAIASLSTATQITSVIHYYETDSVADGVCSTHVCMYMSLPNCLSSACSGLPYVFWLTIRTSLCLPSSPWYV